MKKHNFFYGIQKKVILFITWTVVLMFLVTFLGVNRIVKKEQLSSLTKQNQYYNERMLSAFEEAKNQVDQITADFILNEYVQKSLTNQTFTTSDTEMLKKGLAFLNQEYMDSYLIIDNKEHTYSHSKISLNMDEFYESAIFKSLGDEYSKTKLIWAKDVIFGTEKMCFFAVRYIREMNTVHEPGILVLKLNDSFLDGIRSSIVDERFAYFIVDENDEICYGKLPGGEEWDTQKKESDSALWQEILKKMENPDTQKLEDGILSLGEEAETGFQMLTYAPKEVSMGVIIQIERILAAIFVLSGGSGIVAALFYARKLTRPIKYLSETMSNFDETHLSQRILLETNTELDQIGMAYNGMVERVGNLMSDVQKKERELRKSELQSLLYQIRPHFLYNTLDTIYMLARISKEETIMKMIQALSKFLRINLSNGNEEISVEKELEHVAAYLEIQKIRNTDLFEYELELDDEAANLPIIKMLLQPVAENAIKYGFCDIYEGGRIKISAHSTGGHLCLETANNGIPLGEKQMLYLNSLEKMDMDEMDQLIQNRQGGFGISNVVRRLRMRYQDQVRFFYKTEKEWTICRIEIPLTELSEEETEA